MHALFCTTLALTLLPALAAPQKSVLFLFEDDGGFALGAYGDKVSQTPHLDALAARGTVFDQAYTSVSSCSPSRASLLTGLPTHQNGQFGLLNCNFYSFPGIQALPNILTASGVRTGIIGKYHVAAGSTSPGSAYNFSWGNSAAGPGGCQAGASDSCPDTDYNTVSRNITYMRAQADSFLQWAQGDPFFFYVGFGDSHRCSGEQGAFCENYGRDKSGASTIPDWVPFVPSSSSVQLPFWVQDTPIARQDYANMLTAKSRMDQGVGLILDSLEASGRANHTLVIYFAGKTNFYSPGLAEPLIISRPGAPGGGRTQELASELDLMPTILDWLGVAMPDYRLNGAAVKLQGRTLLPLLGGPAAPPRTAPHEQVMTAAHAAAAAAAAHAAQASAPPIVPSGNYTRVHASHQWHEQQMYFPVRAVVASDAALTWRYKLILNIAHLQPYPVASDLWGAPAFQDLLQRNASGQPTHWYRTLDAYLGAGRRGQYELFDLLADPQELSNLAAQAEYAGVLAVLSADIKQWQVDTNDDWLIKYVHE